MYSKEVFNKIDSLSRDKRERVLKFIQREEEVGRFPAESELLEIINYLIGKRDREIHRNTLSGFISIDEDEEDKLPLPSVYTLHFNCGFCKYFQLSLCKNEKSILYNSKINTTIICKNFEQNS